MRKVVYTDRKDVDMQIDIYNTELTLSFNDESGWIDHTFDLSDIDIDELIKDLELVQNRIKLLQTKAMLNNKEPKLERFN